jgi:hypothetical protein
MKLGSLLRAVAFVGAVSALNMACVAHAEIAGPAEAPAPPPPPEPAPPEPPPPVVFVDPPVLVTIEPGVWVVQDSDYPVYEVDDYYWVYRGNVWYRSQSYSGGWAVADVDVVPPTIVHRDHAMYVHYRGGPNAVRRKVAVERPRPEVNRGAVAGRSEEVRDSRARTSSSTAVEARQEQARSPVERVQAPAKTPESDPVGRERAVNARPTTPAPAPTPAPRPNASVEYRRAAPAPPPKKH